MNNKLSKELFFSKTRDYLDAYLVTQCGKSPHTVKAYRDALTIFRRYVNDEKGLSIMKFCFSDCTRDLVLDFMVYLRGKGYAESSCNQRLSAIKAYLWYVSDNDLLLQPTALSISRVPFLKGPRLARPIIEPEALTALLSSPPNTKIGIRDRTILILLYDSAIRLEELLGLKLSDLNMQTGNPYLRIHGKGNKERLVAITEKTMRHIRLYMGYYHANPTHQNRPLFYTVVKSQMHVMSPGNVERIINKYADAIRGDYPDLPERVHPHMFRNPNLNKIQTIIS